VPRVIYAWAGLPQLPEVAQQLQQSLGWDPVLWISYEYQRNRVQSLFPGTPWHDLEDAFVGLPIPGVNSTQPPAPDASTLMRLQGYLPRLMNQMNRFGPPDRFLYDERESFARDLLLLWHEVLTTTSPDIVFFEEPPNAPYNYALYVLCQVLGVRTVYLNATSVRGLTLVREEIEAPPLRVAEAFEARRQMSGADELPQNLRESVALLTEHDDFSHWYMRVQQEFDAESEAAPHLGTAPAPRSRAHFVIQKAVRALRIWKWPLFLRNALAERRRKVTDQQRREQTTKSERLKFAGVPIGVRECLVGDMEDYQAEARAFKQRLRADYLARCEEPDLQNDKYVYFPLHYRPERTSNPDGGVFYDQIIPISMISEALPDGWLIYVKEHPSQLSMMLAGECGRTTQYYDEIARLRGVKFIEPDYSSKALLMHSQAAATITGTIAWEAALNGRRAFYFGFPWFQGCPGTTQVTSSIEIARLLRNLQQDEPSEQEMRAYLLALADAAFPYVQNSWTFDPPIVTEAEQFAGIIDALSWWHRERFMKSN